MLGVRRVASACTRKTARPGSPENPETASPGEIEGRVLVEIAISSRARCGGDLRRCASNAFFSPTTSNGLATESRSVMHNSAMRRPGPFVLLAIACGVLCSCATAPTTGEPDLMSLIAGTWGWTNTPASCAENPHRLDLDLDRWRLTIRYEKPTRRYDGAEVTESSYDVLALRREEGSILLAMDDERRLDANGNPVRWRLRFVEFEGRQAYVWERLDLPDGSWGPIVRCSK